MTSFNLSLAYMCGCVCVCLHFAFGVFVFIREGIGWENFGRGKKGRELCKNKYYKRYRIARTNRMSNFPVFFAVCTSVL